MSSNTTYTVFINDEAGETRSRKNKAIELAEQAFATNPKDKVEVRTNAGTVVWPAPEVEVAEAPVTEPSNRTKPFSRVEDPNFEIEAPEGYEPAYTRARVSAVVFRKTGEKGDYVVVQVDGEGKVVVNESAANTTEAREITNRLAAEHREAKAKADAEAKETRDREKAEKAEAKAKADADKAAAKEAARVAKETEAAEAEAELVNA